MKILVIYQSIHHRNTEKIAKVMADALEAELVKPKDVNIDNIAEYDLIGFGSGIYFQKHHRSLLKLADELPAMNKKVFIFSTRGDFFPFRDPLKYHLTLKNKLLNKNFQVIGEFSCRGLSTYYRMFRMIGGINKGRPNSKDLKKAKAFVENLKRKIS